MRGLFFLGASLGVDCLVKLREVNGFLNLVANHQHNNKANHDDMNYDSNIKLKIINIIVVFIALLVFSGAGV